MSQGSGNGSRLRLPETPVVSSSLTVARLLPDTSRAMVAALASLLLAGAALSVAFILLTAKVVGSIPRVVDAGLDSPDGRRMFVLLGSVAGVFALQQLLASARDVLAESMGRRLDIRLRGRVMAATLQPVGISHLESPDLLNKIALARSVGIGNVTPGDAIGALVGNAATRLQILAAAGIVATYNAVLALVIVTGGLMARTRMMSESARWVAVVTGRAQNLRRAHYFRDLALTPSAAKETRVFGMGDWVRERFTGHWLDVMNELWRERKAGTRAIGVWFVPVIAGVLVTLVLAGRAAARGELSLAQLAAVAQAAVAAAAVYMTDADLIVQYGAAGIPGVLQLEEATAESGDELTGRLDAGTLPAVAIEFEDVGFGYAGRDDRVFTGLQLRIPVGRSLAIVGPNGAGKTTLVKLLARLYDPDSGRVSVDGSDLREIDPLSWRRRLAVIFQDFVQYELPASDNVGLAGLDGTASDLHGLQRAAVRAGADAIIQGLPNGWHTILSREYEQGAELSGGQWQRVALARALYAVERGATVLVLDEPTANLDVRAEAELFDRFLELTVGLTTILISHRFSSVRHADHIVVVEDGRVVEEGTHGALMVAGGRYAEMFRLQAARFTDAEHA